MIIMSVDYGDVRTGIAVCDRLESLSHPVEVINQSYAPKVINRICSLIEERKPEEVTEMWYKERMAPVGVKVFNPAFDVTPHEYVAAIITEKGIIHNPNKETMAQFKKEKM